jgi:hypothetical protein
MGNAIEAVPAGTLISGGLASAPLQFDNVTAVEHQYKSSKKQIVKWPGPALAGS